MISTSQISDEINFHDVSHETSQPPPRPIKSDFQLSVEGRFTSENELKLN
jgi:hypothetical protein